MPNRFSSYPYNQTDTVACPKCATIGVIKWDCVPHGIRKDFVSVTGEFYERLSSTAPYPLELVWTGCNVVVLEQPDVQTEVKQQ